jgi:hypothetical protein
MGMVVSSVATLAMLGFVFVVQAAPESHAGTCVWEGAVLFFGLVPLIFIGIVMWAWVCNRWRSKHGDKK